MIAAYEFGFHRAMTHRPLGRNIPWFRDRPLRVPNSAASPSEITIFDSVGFALEYYSALRLLHALTQEAPDVAGRSIYCRCWTIQRTFLAVRWAAAARGRELVGPRE